MQRAGASFEIVELDVTAGDDVAFAWALLRCGTEDELRRDPTNRLRLTVGLCRQGDRWVVTHEHHSFPDRSVVAGSAPAASSSGYDRPTHPSDGVSG